MQQSVTLIPYDKENAQVALFIYDQTALQETNARLEDLNTILENQSHNDPLTQLYNRRYFAEESLSLISFSKRENYPLSIIILDIDRFKNINDTYGHHTGDEVIIALANILKKHTRKSDIVARFGGEEFVLLLNNSTLNNGKILAQKIREKIENFVLESKQHGTITFTASFGVTQYNDELDKESIEHTISRADKALYEAKRGGRNKVVVK
jgi:diguanylate cyclase (GGDEF)-like protein